MEQKHTPGPWEWHRSYGWLLLVHYTGDTFPNGERAYVQIADDGSAGGEYSPSIDVNGRNARLIAAAPDLLETLREIAALDYTRAAINGCAYRANQLARVAIVQATGEDS